MRRKCVEGDSYVYHGFTIAFPLYAARNAAMARSPGEGRVEILVNNDLRGPVDPSSFSISPAPSPSPATSHRFSMRVSPIESSEGEREEEEEEGGELYDSICVLTMGDDCANVTTNRKDIAPRQEYEKEDKDKRSRSDSSLSRRSWIGPSLKKTSYDVNTDVNLPEGEVGRVIDYRELKVLVVDDAPLNRKMLRRLMQRHTGFVDEACDGKEALRLVRVAMERYHSYDLILMDFQMPVMTGPEAAYQMRKEGFHGRIIGVTGNVMDVDLDYFLSQGANQVLTKPVSVTALQKIIGGEKPTTVIFISTSTRMSACWHVTPFNVPFP